MTEKVTNVVAAIFAALIIGGIALAVLWWRGFELTALLISMTLGTTFLVCFLAMRQDNG